MADARIFCNKCGGQNLPTAGTCSSCGAPQSSGSGPVAPQIPDRPFRTAPLVRYAGFWIRLVAALIDAVLIQIVVRIISPSLGFMPPIRGMSIPLPWPVAHPIPMTGRYVFVLMGSWLYKASMESSSWQATLGKVALGLKVVDLQGNQISFARASGRYFAKMISVLIFMIGYIMAGFTRQKQALHDMIAETLVLRTRS